MAVADPFSCCTISFNGFSLRTRDSFGTTAGETEDMDLDVCFVSPVYLESDKRRDGKHVDYPARLSCARQARGSHSYRADHCVIPCSVLISWKRAPDQISPAHLVPNLADIESELHPLPLTPPLSPEG
jgi:hypothetical protein